MIVKIINCTLGLGLVLFIATAPIVPRHHSNANETFQNVAAELGINAPAAASRSYDANPTNEAAATSETADEEEDYSDGCIIDYSEDGEYLF